MLSIQDPHLQPQQHRRQNSTPTSTGHAKGYVLPAYQSSNGAHRRGLSVDQSVQLRPQRKLLPQDHINGNTNEETQQHQQQNLREAQQQRLGQPGLQVKNYTNEFEEYQITNGMQNMTNLEFGLGSRGNTLLETQSHPFDTTFSGLLDSPIGENSQFYQYFAPSSSAGTLDGFGIGHENTDLHLLNSEYTNDQVQLDGKNDICDSLLQHEILEELQRPRTPQHQTSTSKFEMGVNDV